MPPRFGNPISRNTDTRRDDNRRDDNRRDDNRRDDTRQFKRKLSPPRGTDGRFFKRAHHDETSLDLVSNAFQITLSPDKPKLYVFTVKFEGPRQLNITNERIKQRILTNSAIWPNIKSPKLVQWRDNDGAKLYIVDRDGLGAEEVRSLSYTQVSLKSANFPSKTEPAKDELKPKEGKEEPALEVAVRGEDEVWTVIFEDENAKYQGLTSEKQQPSVWLQFLALLTEGALETGGFNLVGRNGRLVKLDEREWITLRTGVGCLAPGYDKSMMIASDGIFWTFNPRYTLMLDRSMDDEIHDLLRSRRGSQNEVEGRMPLRAMGLFAVTLYCPTNLYNVIEVSWDKKSTDLIEVREKNNTTGEWEVRKISHLEYLRSRYGVDYRGLYDPALERCPLVGCVLAGRRRQMVKNSRVVYIPSKLLRLCCLNTKDLAKNVKEEITRASQLDERQTFARVNDLVAQLSDQKIQDIFTTFGLMVNYKPAKLTGQNHLKSTVTISVDNATSLYLDDNGSFLSDYTKMKRYYKAPVIDDKFLVIYRQHGTRIDEGLIDHFLHCVAETSSSWGWKMTVPSDPVVIWDGSEADLDAKKAAILDFKPKILFVLLPSKNVEDYYIIKRFAFESQIPSQCISAPVLKKFGGKALFRMFVSLTPKFCESFQPWIVDSPLGEHLKTLVCGISTYQTRTVQSYAIVMTTNMGCINIVQDFGKTNSLSPAGVFGDLRVKFRGLLRRIVAKHNFHPTQAIVYRKGLGDSVLDDVNEIEGQMIQQAMDDVFGSQKWDPKTETLTLRFPAFREKGTYTLEVPCAIVNGSGERRINYLKKKVEADWKVVTDPLNDGPSKMIELSTQIDCRSQGVPDIINHGIGLALPEQTTKPARLPRQNTLALITVNPSPNSKLAFFKPDNRRIPCGTIINEYADE